MPPRKKLNNTAVVKSLSEVSPPGVEEELCQHRAMALLEMVGIAEKGEKRPEQLSGGEQQRVAIALSLANDPALILADEPTGNLDRRSGQEILSLLRTLNDQENLTIVMVTHDNDIARKADRLVQLDHSTEWSVSNGLSPHSGQLHFFTSDVPKRFDPIQPNQ